MENGCGLGGTGSRRENDKIDTYLQSREVFSRCPTAILVDAFLFVQPCRQRLEERWHGAEAARIFYFLSHFHSDHYAGLTPSQAAAVGTVYASRPTAELVVAQLGVPRMRMVPMDFGLTYVFSMITGDLVGCSDGGYPVGRPGASGNGEDARPQPHPGPPEEDVFTVRLIPANHCPGAAMLLFSSTAFGTTLHTGDFRFNGSAASWRAAAAREGYWAAAPRVDSPLLNRPPSLPVTPVAGLPEPSYEYFIEDDPALRGVAGAVDTLFLDNTFCDPKFCFLPQWRATQWVVAQVRAMLLDTGSRQPVGEGEGVEPGRAPATTSAPSAANESNDKSKASGPVRSCAVLIGTYTIGKERVALALQDAFAPLSAGSELPIHAAPTKVDLLTAAGFPVERLQRLSCAPSAVKRSSSDEGERLPDANAAAVSEASDLKEVRPNSVAVTLPVRVFGQHGAADAVARSLFHSSTESRNSRSGSGSDHDPADIPSVRNDRGGERQFHLTLLLVPFAAVAYPTLAAACGRPLPRGRVGGHIAQGPTSAGRGPPLLNVGDGFGLDLTQYDGVLAVAPTGWARKPSIQSITRTVRLCKVPYSEHCAFQELLSFVGFVNPRRVVPTVSLEQYKSHEPLFVERAPRLQSRLANAQPLSRFFFTCAKREREVGGAVADEPVGRGDHPAYGKREAPMKPSNPFATRATGPPSASGGCSSSLTMRIGQETGAVVNSSANHTTALVRPQQRATLSFSAAGVLARSIVAPLPAKRGDSSETDDSCVVVCSRQVVIEISDDDGD